MNINGIDEPLQPLLVFTSSLFVFLPSLWTFFILRQQTCGLVVLRPASEQLRDVLASARGGGAQGRHGHWGGSGGRHPIRQQLRHTYR